MYYHDTTDETSRRGTVMVDAASPMILPATTPLQERVLVNTVEVQTELFTWRGIKAATATRDLQNIMLVPVRHNMERISRDDLIKYSPVITDRLTHANHI